MNLENGCFLEDVQINDKLAPLKIPITRTLIVASAIATRDYQDVHHDPGLAQERGLKDIFMNIFTTMGFVSRLVTDWAGAAARLKKIDIKLGVPNFPGDVMMLAGNVTQIKDNTVEIEIRGANSLGDHVTGTVIVELARRSP